MRAYKGFRICNGGKLKCRDMYYEPGETYKFDGEIKLCSSGFHACHELWQTWYYYPNDGNTEYRIVECGGETKEDSSGKIACSEITILEKVNTLKVAQFDDCHHFDYGYAIIRNGEKKNYIDKTGKLVSRTWFDNAFSFENGYSLVNNNGKWNFLTKEGKMLFEKWLNYDFCFGFDKNGIALVYDSRNKCNIIDTEGKLLSIKWVDFIGPFKNGTAYVEMDGKQGYIDTKGKITFDKKK